MEIADLQLPEEDEVFALLTSRGRHPVEFCISLRKGIYRWDARSGMFQGFLIDNTAMAQACREYLQAKGRAFSSPDELEKRAVSEQWLNPERLFPQIASWNSRWTA